MNQPFGPATSPPSPVDSGICLITGGAGFLGINLVRLLLAQGLRLRSIDIAAFDYPERSQLDARLADVRDLAAVEQAMAGVDTVVHCAAALPLASDAEIHTTDVEGTRVMLDAALRHGVARFIFISSTAVYGVPTHLTLREEEPMQGVGPYGCAKVEAEGLCADYRRRGLCVSILRPKTFVGPERLGAFELLYDWAFEGHGFPVLGSGHNPYQLLDVEDLCQVIQRCMRLDASVVNDVFNVGADVYSTMRDNLQAVLDRAGHGKHVVGLPAGPAQAVLRALAALRLSPLYPWIYETANHDSVVCIERLQHQLGYTPRYSNREALLRNYDWYVQHRDEYRGQAGVSHRLPWKRGALGVAKWLF